MVRDYLLGRNRTERFYVELKSDFVTICGYLTRYIQEISIALDARDTKLATGGTLAEISWSVFARDTNHRNREAVGE